MLTKNQLKVPRKSRINLFFTSGDEQIDNRTSIIHYIPAQQKNSIISNQGISM